MNYHDGFTEQNDNSEKMKIYSETTILNGVEKVPSNSLCDEWFIKLWKKPCHCHFGAGVGRGGDLNTLSSGGWCIIDYYARVIIHNMLFYLLWPSKV